MSDYSQEDDLSAFALGALDIEEVRQISEHLAACSLCRTIAERYRAVALLLPYGAPPQDPPKRLKLELLARIATVVEEAVR